MDEINKLESTPMKLLEIAMSQNADIEKLTKLMDLQERWEKNNAKIAYTNAMAKFKLSPPRIEKDKEVKFLDVKYKHAELGQVSEIISKALAEVGISHAWAVKQEQNISVTCTLTHELGHSESVTISAPADVSGKKNPIQSIGSTISYLQRYTLLSVAGVATGEFDDDAMSLTPAVDMVHHREWSPEDKRDAKTSMLNFLEELVNRGYPEDVMETGIKKSKQWTLIGDTEHTYDEWKNKMTVFYQTTSKKYPVREAK